MAVRVPVLVVLAFVHQLGLQDGPRMRFAWAELLCGRGRLLVVPQRRGDGPPRMVRRASGLLGPKVRPTLRECNAQDQVAVCMV